jgi:hypothetical protein
VPYLRYGNGTTGANQLVLGPLVLIYWYWGPLVLLSIDAESTGTEPSGTGTAFVRIYSGKGVSLTTLTTVML